MTEDYERHKKAINQNRELLTKNIRVYKFYDKLRSKSVISHEDYEEIDNSTLHPTGAEKAGYLLDMIETKGPIGMTVFLELLDEHYPHLYEQVTGLDSMARTQVPSPDVVASYQPHNVIDLDGVRKLTAQLDELSRFHAADQLSISELREEIFKLRFINTTCRTKLSRYPKVLEKNKQMDLEIKELREWELNMVVKINQLERENVKLRFERKEHKQMIDQLQQKLEDAVDMHANQKHNWERTNSKNEQLAQDKNNLEKKLEHMQREMETVKRQSSLWSSDGNFQISIDKTNQDPQAVIEILRVDLEETRNTNKELVDRLYHERSEMERMEIQFEKAYAECGQLKDMLSMWKKNLEITDRNYQLAWQELQKVSAERNYAYEQRDRAQSDAQDQRKQKDRMQEVLNEQLMQFKQQLYDRPPSPSVGLHVNGVDREPQDDLLTPDGLSRHKPLRLSGYSDTSGVSSGQASSIPDSDRKSATLPAQLHEMRPRSTRMTRPGNFQHRNNPNPFPEADFPLTLDTGKTKILLGEEHRMEARADKEACKNGCVTPDDVAKSFAERPSHFADSVRSDLAQRGSSKHKGYDKVVDLWMKQSFKVRPPLDNSFSIDYEDEHDDLEAIFADDLDAVEDFKRKQRKLKRHSRSESDLTQMTDSSSDSDELQRRPRRPQAQRYRSTFRHAGIFTRCKRPANLFELLWGSQSSQ